MLPTCVPVDSPVLATSRPFTRADQPLTIAALAELGDGLVPLETLILGSIRLGILVISTDLQAVYVNAQATTLCQAMQETLEPELPAAVQSACRQFLQAPMDRQPWQSYYESDPADLNHYLLIRLKVRWLSSTLLATATPLSTLLLVTLEDYSESVHQEMQQEKRQFGLTDRETEIGTLLRLGWTYQAIADRMHISVNTVKSHVRHLYNKRRRPFNSGPFDVCDRAVG